VIVTVQIAARTTALDITNEMRRACESLVGPITETMLDLLTRVEPEFQDRVRHNVILAGGGSRIPGLAAALERALDEAGGGAVRAVEDPIFAGSNGSLAIALDGSDTDWEQLS
jgi:rod shape-determining protein MreB